MLSSNRRVSYPNTNLKLSSHDILRSLLFGGNYPLVNRAFIQITIALPCKWQVQIQ